MHGDGFTLRIIRAVYYENDQNWNFLINLYPYNTAYFILGGDGFVKIGEQTTPLLPGHAYLIPANTIYSCWCNTRIEKLYVEFTLEVVPGMDVFSGQDGIAERAVPMEGIQALCKDHNSPFLTDQMRFHGALMGALSRCPGNVGQEPGLDKMRFKPILWDIQRNLYSDIRLSELAARHGWNPSTLSHAFKKAFGLSLKQYVERLLVNALKQDLVLTDKRLSLLAADYRFCDAYYLSAFFKRHMELSPTVYRKMFAGRPDGPRYRIEWREPYNE